MSCLGILSLVAALLTLANAQGNNGQYTPWGSTTTDGWGYETTTTAEYWPPTTTSEYWVPTTTSYWPETTTYTTPYTTPYAWTSYTTVTSCYTENGVTITITTWVPCPCDNMESSTTPIVYSVGTTTQTLVTTTTPGYSTFTSNGIVYVVPYSTQVTATASAGLEIVNASDASKSTEIDGWVGILSLVVLGGFAIVAVVL